MSIESNDGVTMIGMHTLESLTADGLLPQLQALASRPRNHWTCWNVVNFPSHLARSPGAASAIELGPDAADGTNIVPFRQRSSGDAGHFREA